MNRSVVAGASFIALAAVNPAFAAPPAIYNWTGFYVGGNVGYSFGKADTNLSDPSFTEFGSGFGLPGSFPAMLHPDGVIGGGQFGYNWQNGPAIFGFETDFQGSDEKASAIFSTPYSCDVEGTCTLSQTRDARINWFGTVRGRIGWLISPMTMMYGTAGLAYGKVSVSGTVLDDPFNTGAGFTFSDSKVKAGLAVGGGIEGAVTGISGLTVKVEYLYIDLGTLSGSGLNPITGNIYTWDARFSDHIARIGFNYKLP